MVAVDTVEEGERAPSRGVDELLAVGAGAAFDATTTPLLLASTSGDLVPLPAALEVPAVLDAEAPSLRAATTVGTLVVLVSRILIASLRRLSLSPVQLVVATPVLACF